MCCCFCSFALLAFDNCSFSSFTSSDSLDMQSSTNNYKYGDTNSDEYLVKTIDF